MMVGRPAITAETEALKATISGRQRREMLPIYHSTHRPGQRLNFCSSSSTISLKHQSSASLAPSESTFTRRGDSAEIAAGIVVVNNSRLSGFLPPPPRLRVRLSSTGTSQWQRQRRTLTRHFTGRSRYYTLSLTVETS